MKFSLLKNVRRQPFLTKIKHAKHLCNIRRPMPILVTQVWQRNLDYAKNLQAKYFTSKNIMIYGTSLLNSFIQWSQTLTMLNNISYYYVVAK